MKWTASLLLVPLLACAPAARQTPGDDDGTGGGGDDDGTGGGGGGGNSDSGCSDAAKLIYVVDENNNLAQFNAGSKTFTALGVLDCPAGIDSEGDPAEPFSMAVDRSAQAYVLYNDNAIYKVDTTQSGLPCTATGWTTSSDSALQEFGMGYSSDAPGSDADHLFVAGGQDLDSSDPPTTSTLATLDMTAFTSQHIGPLNGWPELTGNANAELWGFFPDVMGNNSTTPEVAQIDKAGGSNFLTEYPEPSLDGTNKQPSAWAFGFYGGDYWVFLAFYNEETLESGQTSVYQIAGPSSTSGSPGQLVSTTPAAVSGTPLVIVGAGVSTCAPVVIQ